MSNHYVYVDIDFVNYIDNEPDELTICIGSPLDGKFYISDLSTADQLEDLESELEQIAFQIRDFRMKNFPESESIDE